MEPFLPRRARWKPSVRHREENQVVLSFLGLFLLGYSFSWDVAVEPCVLNILSPAVKLKKKRHRLGTSSYSSMKWSSSPSWRLPGVLTLACLKETEMLRVLRYRSSLLLVKRKLAGRGHAAAGRWCFPRVTRQSKLSQACRSEGISFWDASGPYLFKFLSSSSQL